MSSVKVSILAVDDEFEAAKLADELPLTAEQMKELAAYEKEMEGVVY